MTLEEAIVHLVRLGMKGDSVSVGRFAKRLLRDFARNAGVGGETRQAIAALVASAPAPVQRFVASPVSDGATFLTVVEPNGVEEPILDVAVAKEVEQLIGEHKRTSDLEAVGLLPTRTVLLTGAPGVGKTLTARWIAERLGVPLFRADLSALMSSYLGRTGQNLRAAFAEARTRPSVMLLDEFDALAKRRDDPTDVGELKRIVNVLLLELEAWPATGILIAATNHPELLDRAIWRRFERTVHIGLPTEPVRERLLIRQLKMLGQTVDASTLRACVAATVGKSGSDIVGTVRAALRRAVLSADPKLDRTLVGEFVQQLRDNAISDPEARADYCLILHEHLGMTQRQIAAGLGVSHVTVGKALRAGTMRSLTRGDKQVSDG